MSDMLEVFFNALDPLSLFIAVVSPGYSELYETEELLSVTVEER